MVMATLRSLFSVLLIVYFSADVAELTCTELEVIDPQSGNMTHKVNEENVASLNFQLNARNCSTDFNSETIVKVSTFEGGYLVDLCKFSLTLKNCTMTQSSPECRCSPQDKGLAHFYTRASWSGDKNVTIKWTDKITKVERQQTIMVTSLGQTGMTASNDKSIGTRELTVLVTAALSCVFSIVIVIAFVCTVRNKRKKKVKERNRARRQEARDSNTTSVYDVVSPTAFTRGKERNMAVRQEAHYLDRTSVYDLANARAFGRNDSSHYSEVLELPATYLHPSPVLSGHQGRRVVAL